MLLLLILIPTIGAIVAAFLPDQKLAKNWALLVSIVTLGVALACTIGFDFHQDLSGLTSTQAADKAVQLQFGAGKNYIGIDNIGFRLKLGVDSISLWLVLLTAILQPLAILASFESIKDRAKEYYAWMLALLAAMMGCFVARDVLLFYAFFELTLIPMFFIIGVWGGPQKQYAAAKFFLFTFTGSVFTLAGLVYLGFQAGSYDINTIVYTAQHLSSNERFWILLSLLAGFAVKVPLFPVHTWLPLAHTEAPTAGSVILAGVLLKLGTYGLLRFAVPIGFVAATGGVIFAHAIHVLAVFCIIGIIYGALVAWVQEDIKKLVAYSSVSHLGFCVLGLLALNSTGMQGSVMYMINHGISTGALFLCIGMIYDRYHTRDINELSGLAKIMPKLAFFLVLFTMSSIGLPGTNGFVSEFLTVLGAFTSQHLGIAYGSFAALGVILGAVYMLHMVARVLFGPLKFPGMAGAGDAHEGAGHTAHGVAHGQEDAGQTTGTGHGGAHGGHQSTDINSREIAILTPLAVLVFVLGFFPVGVMRTMNEPLAMIANPVDQPTANVTDRDTGFQPVQKRIEVGLSDR